MPFHGNPFQPQEVLYNSNYYLMIQFKLISSYVSLCPGKTESSWSPSLVNAYSHF